MDYYATCLTSPQSDSEVQQTKGLWIAAIRDLRDLLHLNKEKHRGLSSTCANSGPEVPEVAQVRQTRCGSGGWPAAPS